MNRQWTGTLFPLSKTAVVASRLGLMPFQPQAFKWVYRYQFSPIDLASNSISKCLVTSLTDVPLKYCWAHLAWKIGYIACRVQLSKTVDDTNLA